MLCEHCHEREATVHYTKVINDEKTEYHLCEQCARESGELDFSFGFDGGFSIHNLLAGLMEMGAPGPSAEKREARGLHCPECGTSFAQFAKSGRLGCAHCYTAFNKRLEPLLRRVQGISAHGGKIPQRVGGAIKLERRIRSLTKELEAAVEQEEFETAAVLRDQLRELRERLRSEEEGEESGE